MTPAKCARCGEVAAVLVNHVPLCGKHALEQTEAEDKLKRGRE